MLNLNLPKSVQPKVVAMQQYASLVNSMGSEELASNQKLYEIQLKNVPLPKVDESVQIRPKAQPSAPVVTPKESTTSTTIVRRDQEGNVVDVQKSQSHVEGSPRSSNGNSRPQENEISDPFN